MKRVPLVGLLLALLGVTACGTENTGTATAAPVTITEPVTVTVPVTMTVTAQEAAEVPQETPTPESVGAADDTAIPGLPSEGTDVDPCGLVKLIDAEKLAATKLDPAQKSGQVCTYTGPVTGPTAQVQVFVGPGAKKQLDIEKELKHPLRKLAGVGTESYVAEWAVYVSKGGLWVSVLLVRLNDAAENVTRLEQIAKTVASRM